MSHPAEQRVRAPTDVQVYDAAKSAFPNASDDQIIAELMRIIVLVAVSCNDIIEDGQPHDEVLARKVFFDCEELAECFPWPD